MRDCDHLLHQFHFIWLNIFYICILPYILNTHTSGIPYKLKNSWKKCFDQLLGARSTQKLVEIHNTSFSTRIWNMVNWTTQPPWQNGELNVKEIFRLDWRCKRMGTTVMAHKKIFIWLFVVVLSYQRVN